METIILASASPRRRKILKQLGIPFISRTARLDEIIPADIKAEDASEYLAARKVDAVVKSLIAGGEASWVLGADTTVIYKNKVFGKPKDQSEARQFLSVLQGNTHEVVTGIALFNAKLHHMDIRKSVNTVTFGSMTEKEIEQYLETREWYGAAGAYQIQGAASCFIKRIDGTESSIAGLPIFELCDMLKMQGYEFTV